MSERSRVIVTGAARGIGRAIAESFDAAGWQVGVLDLDAEGAAATAAALSDGVALVAATNDEPAVESAFETFGPIDAVVNNAGIVRFGPLAELSTDDWRATVDVNLNGTFIVARHAARVMAAAGGGSIVSITSINGVIPGPFSGAYGPTKAAIAMLTQLLAIEFGSEGVRVNSVAPGFVDGGMSEAIYADPEARATRTGAVPLGRLGECDDIANVVRFLCSEDASYITGQNLVVDGGVLSAPLANLPRPKSVDSRGSE